MTGEGVLLDPFGWAWGGEGEVIFRGSHEVPTYPGLSSNGQTLRLRSWAFGEPLSVEAPVLYDGVIPLRPERPGSRLTEGRFSAALGYQLVNPPIMTGTEGFMGSFTAEGRLEFSGALVAHAELLSASGDTMGIIDRIGNAEVTWQWGPSFVSWTIDFDAFNRRTFLSTSVGGGIAVGLTIQVFLVEPLGFPITTSFPFTPAGSG